MPDVTMVEAAKYSQEVMDPVVALQIAESTPILEYLPVKTINGPAFRHDRELSLGGIAFRGVNGSWNASIGTIQPVYEGLAIMGGEVFIDNFQIKTQNVNGRDLKKDAYRRKSRALGMEYTEQFFEGDTAVNDYGFDGLRKKLPTTGTQVINAATGGATLTLRMVDQLLGKVVGPNNQKHLFMNRRVNEIMTELTRTQTGTARIEYSSSDVDNFNRQISRYAGAFIHIMEREDNAATFLDFDEDDGSGNMDTASIYCTRFGMDYLHTIAQSGIPSVQDFGEIQARPGHLGRIEWYVGGPVIRHVRAAARLHHINNAFT